MTDIHVVPSALLQPATVVHEPNQVQVVTYNDHARAVCELEHRANRAYTQRNNAAVALVRMALLLGWPAGRGLDSKTESNLTWRHVVYIDLPGGEQVSYHMAPDDVPLLEGLPEYAGEWDGKFTGTTTWANLVPAVPARVKDLTYTPEKLTHPGSGPAVRITHSPAPFSMSALTPSEESEAGVTRTADGVTYGGFTLGPLTQVSRIRGAGNTLQACCGSCPGGCPIGLANPLARCASAEPCQNYREPGKLFCGTHSSVESRFRGSPITNEQLSYMMQRDGEQQ
jgi:hypothetical protein